VYTFVVVNVKFADLQSTNFFELLLCYHVLNNIAESLRSSLYIPASKLQRNIFFCSALKRRCSWHLLLCSRRIVL
jgi:hypothetical protein